MSTSRFRSLLAICAAATLCACVDGSTISYVDSDVTATNSERLAADAVDYLATPLPPARTTLVMQPPRGDDPLTPILLEKLRTRGYGVVIGADAAQGEQGTPIRYLASPLGTGVVLRLEYHGTVASRFYARGQDGNLTPGSPFSVREGDPNEQR